MSETRTRVGGTARLGWKISRDDGLALGRQSKTRPLPRSEQRGGVERPASRPVGRRVPAVPPGGGRRPSTVAGLPAVPEWHGQAVGPERSHRVTPKVRRLAIIVSAGALVVTMAAILPGIFGHNDSYPMPGAATLASMSVPQRIVAIAQSQVGYSADPSNSYCNKFSAYWGAGQTSCPSGETSEEWCADFAAWTWREAGVPVQYGYGPGEINGAAVTFYQWAVANGEWHPAGSGYVASPGDVAVYGLALGTHPSAAHVAVVTANAPGQAGPDVVNGDGDQTGFSVVETGTDQSQIHVGQDVFPLDGFVSQP